MSRTTVKCSEKHTPLSPTKQRIRRDWLNKISDTKDIITISHGIFDACMMLEWRGLIVPCDIDPGVRESILYMRRGQNGKDGQYPDLKIAYPGVSVQDTVQEYCEVSVKNLGAVDIDLACTLKPAWRVLKNVLGTLVQHKFHGKVLLTFRNGRDGFDCLFNRIFWLGSQLPEQVRLTSHTPYNSTRINEDASRSKGSSMCIVELDL